MTLRDLIYCVSKQTQRVEIKTADLRLHNGYLNAMLDNNVITDLLDRKVISVCAIEGVLCILIKM